MRRVARRVTTFLVNIIKFLFKERIELAIFLSAFLVEIFFGLYLIYRWGHTFACGDAVSHLYIPRTVVDNGPYSNFANIGTVWLPMFHLLVMPLTLIDPLYTTGFAGTIVNALATGGVCVLLCRLISEKKLGILASALFMGNAFTLIYGATAMMEQTAIFFMILAAYYFKSYWEKDDITEFMKCSLALIFGTLTRYEVWVAALLLIFFFMLRELKNGKRYRIAFAHLPLWGIFAWLFWNLAIFRDPLMFIHQPSAGGGTASFWLATNYVFQGVFAISGILGLLALLSVVFLFFHRKLSQLVPAVILISPIMVHWSLMSYWSWVRFFYMGLPGLIALPLLLAGQFKKRLKVITIVAIIVAYSTAYQFQILVLATGTTPGVVSDLNFSDISLRKEEVMAIKEVVSNQSILLTAHFMALSPLFSVLTNTPPSQIIDEYDYPFYLKAMEKPWEYNITFVVIEKTQPGNPDLKAINDYYGGQYYVYSYYNSQDWQSTFLQHYKLVLETQHYLIFGRTG
jgi:hypothetical protein